MLSHFEKMVKSHGPLNNSLKTVLIKIKNFQIFKESGIVLISFNLSFHRANEQILCK